MFKEIGSKDKNNQNEYKAMKIFKCYSDLTIEEKNESGMSREAFILSC